jgi:hypothetical protein
MMSSNHPTNAVEIFVEMAQAVIRGEAMVPRSENDKEYFAQDWFAQRLDALQLSYLQQGRNSYPDFIVTGATTTEGYEIRSLAFANGRPARRDIDFNSTIPSGRKEGRDIFLVFFLYTGTGSSPRSVHSLSLAHADLINSDHTLADEHINVAIRDFGSYADGFIRNRKMYVFPHPIAIDPEGLGKARLIVPTSWQLADPRLTKVKTLERTIAENAVSSYTIRLRGRGQAEVCSLPAQHARQTLPFDLFEFVALPLAR